MIGLKGKIPVAIHPLFWVTAALIGFLSSYSFLGTVVWMFVILCSVLVHEFGHATTALFFGLEPRIELVALGGVTFHQGEKLPFWKQFIIVLNGPLFGFLLFLMAFFLLKIPQLNVGLWQTILLLFYWVNLLWTVLNLIPVLPLDGGQLLRIVLEAFFGAKGFRYSLIVGMVIAGGASLFFFLMQSILVGALFFLFAFQSFDMFRKLRYLTNTDRDTDVKSRLAAAEKDLQEGKKNSAIADFEAIRKETKEGITYITATQYIAFLKYEGKQTQEAYELLLSIRKHLSLEGLVLLHKLAFEMKNYPLVEELSSTCFQMMATQEVALRNAIACAVLTKAQAAIGWLETAYREGLDNVLEIIKRQEFDSIRSTMFAQQFIKYHQSDTSS